MKNAECAETNKNQISDFSDFYFSSSGHFCDVITPIFDRKNWKIDFSFVSAPHNPWKPDQN